MLLLVFLYYSSFCNESQYQEKIFYRKVDFMSIRSPCIQMRFVATFVIWYTKINNERRNKWRKATMVCLYVCNIFIILSGCSSNKKSEAKEDNSLLQPGTVWKEEVGGLIHNLKIIDDTTWEYSESVWHPDPVQITVKRQKTMKV